MINLAVNGNATATDYDNVMKLLNDIGPVDRREDLLRALQTELETFQSTQQTNYTINFYQNLLSTIKQSESSIVSTKHMPLLFLTFNLLNIIIISG